MDELTLLDWKRRIFELYAEIRSDRASDARVGALARGSRRALPLARPVADSCRQPARVHRAAALPLRPGVARVGAGGAGRARAAGDRNLGRAALLVHAVRPGQVRARRRRRRSTSTGSRATAAGCSSRSPTRPAAPRPTAPAATCSTPSREPTWARRTAVSCSISTSRTTRRARTTRAGSARSRRPATAWPWPCGAASGSLTRLRQSPRDRPLPQVPPPDLRGGRRSGSGRADAHERDRAGQGAAGVPLRRPARHRQDISGADPRQIGELPARPDGDSRQHVPLVRGDHERLVARRDRDGRSVAAWDRRHPRDPGARRAAAGGRPLEGLHPRRGAPADGRRVERAVEADRRAAAAPALHLLHDRAAEGAADGALALPDLRLPAAAPARADQQAAADRRRRGDRRARLGARTDRARWPGRLP